MKKLLILALAAAAAALAVCPGSAWAQDIPSPDRIQALVKASMLDFALAVKAKDFTGFHRNIAKFWQAQTSPSQLAQIFKSFIDQEIDLTVMGQFRPTFAKKPAIDSQGWLVAEGSYATKSLAADFVLKYKKEEADWKLVGIEVNIAPSQTTMPSEEELKELVNSTILDLAIAIKAKDFTGFYNKIASLWKGQTTAQALAENFRSFSDQNMDLTVLQALDPVFTKAPALDENDWVGVEGYYPSEPSRTYFSMKYLNEDGVWKLAAIDLNVTPEKN